MRALRTVWAGFFVGASICGLVPAAGADKAHIVVDHGSAAPGPEEDGSEEAPFETIARADRAPPSGSTIAIPSSAGSIQGPSVSSGTYVLRWEPGELLFTRPELEERPLDEEGGDWRPVEPINSTGTILIKEADGTFQYRLRFCPEVPFLTCRLSWGPIHTVRVEHTLPISIGQVLTEAEEGWTVALPAGVYGERLVISSPVTLVARGGLVEIHAPLPSLPVSAVSAEQMIAAADEGSTVALPTGLYAERLSISKRVTLVARDGPVEIYAPSLPICPGERVLVWNPAPAQWDCLLPLPPRDLAEQLLPDVGETEPQPPLALLLARFRELVGDRIDAIEATGVTENSAWLDLTLHWLLSLNCEPGDVRLSYFSCQTGTQGDESGYLEFACRDGTWEQTGICRRVD